MALPRWWAEIQIITQEITSSAWNWIFQGMAEVAIHLFTEEWIFLTMNIHSIYAEFF